MSVVISVEEISKSYRLGQIGTGTFTNDLKLWWAKMRGKPNPLLKIGAKDHGNRDGEEVWALKDVSFDVQQGEVLGIIGRNGAGKSTLLKILSRVTAPTSGQIKVKGRVASLLEVGTGFHPELTGRENIYLNGAILGMTKEEVRRKFDEIVAFAEVEKFIDTPVKRYSSGMYVRLAFAVAAHLEPEILVVDEVLAVGDAEFQKKCLGKMGDVAKEGRTVLFVSHNMAAVISLCKRCLLIEQGKISMVGDADTVVGHYLSYNNSRQNRSLENIANRGGNGSLKFVKWAVNDSIMGLGYSVGCYHPCEFWLEYQSEEGTSLRNVSVAIVIKDCMDRPVLTGATFFQPTEFEFLPPKGKLICGFDHFPLLPDDYQLQLWCTVQGDLSDNIEDAGHFSVTPDDVFGSGKIPKAKHGFVIAPHSWKLE